MWSKMMKLFKELNNHLFHPACLLTFRQKLHSWNNQAPLHRFLVRHSNLISSYNTEVSLVIKIVLPRFSSPKLCTSAWISPSSSWLSPSLQFPLRSASYFSAWGTPHPLAQIWNDWISCCLKKLKHFHLTGLTKSRRTMSAFGQIFVDAVAKTRVVPVASFTWHEIAVRRTVCNFPFYGASLKIQNFRESPQESAQVRCPSTSLLPCFCKELKFSLLKKFYTV